MRNKRFIFAIIILIAACAAGLAALSRTPLLIRSVAMLTAPLFGYDIDAGSFFFSPSVKVDLKGFTVADTRNKNFLFTSSELTIDSTPGRVLKGDVEKVLLKDAKIRIRLGDKKETGADLSFIKKIPSVRLLVMENGEFTLLFKGSGTQIQVKKIELTVKDFSPDGGGSLSFTGLIGINGPGSTELSAAGKCRGTLQLTGIFPDMLGKGIIELDVSAFSAGTVSMKGMKITIPVEFEKGRINITRSSIGIDEFVLRKEGQAAILKKSLIGISARYQTGTGNLTSDNVRITMPGVGSLNGSGRLTLKGTMPVQASLETNDLNFSNLFSRAKSLMTQEEAKKWSIEGQGSLKGRMTGTLSGISPTLSGTITMDIRKGGFASPDGSKAAQGINGLVIMNFTLPRGDKDASLKVSSRLSSGEYLWGRYYKDLSRDRASFSTDADIQTNSKDGSRFKGACDLFQTGRYVYDGRFGEDGWQFHLRVQDIAVRKIVSDFLSTYLAETVPELKGIETEGKLDADISVASIGKKLEARGNIELTTASLKLPAISLDLKRLDVNVPFDLASNGDKAPGVKAGGSNVGWITIAGFRKGEYTLPELKVPVIASGSDIAATGVISVPFYDGSVRIRDLTARDVLGSSPRLSFAGSVSGIDLPRLLNDLTGLTFPGTAKAQFPMVAYQNGELKTEGSLSIDMFGGRIDVLNMYARDVFASSRKIGGDIVFSDIDLGKITETIKIGRITGVVAGSMKDLEVEYDQPSRFVFDLDTVEKRGVTQRVSVDAIENISILGTGSGGIGAILKSGLNRFFKDYPYSRIGIRCTLENDNFNIRGKIMEGGKEYLIRRAFLRGIDVVNRDPHNMVSFKDMQERIGRVFQKNKEDQGPTIKVN
jgi:hypothetical protein